jgi:RNA polymerase sigma-70 factor (ECF subfamily)
MLTSRAEPSSFEQTPDLDLLRRYREGDLASFEALYDRYAAGLLFYARSLTGDRAQAEDVLQEAFIRLMGSDPRGVRDSVRSYLFAIVRNLVIDERRKGAIRAEVRSLLFRERENVPDSGQGEEILSALSQLPRDQRETVVLKIYGSLTLAEVASLTGVPPATATSRYRYALERLNVLLSER